MPDRRSSPLLTVLRFLGQVQFTMLLLLAGVAAMVTGTLVEKSAGAMAAQVAVYRSLWFDGFLFLLAVNLVVAVVNRIPIQRHQWAFVLTHASIVLLLTGAWISRTFGYEGRIHVIEGQETSSLLLDGFELRSRWNEGKEPGPTRVHPIRGGARPSPGPIQAASGVADEAGAQPQLRIRDVEHDGVATTRLVPSPEPTAPPGIEYRVEGPGGHREGWLLADSDQNRRRDLGVLDIEILRARSPAFLAARRKAHEGGGARVRILPRVGDALVIPLPAGLARDFEVGGGIRARVTRFVERTRIDRGEIVEDPRAQPNPAAVVELRRGASVETHTIFSLFPSFNAVRGREAEGLVEACELEATAAVAKPLATVLVGPNDDLWVQLSAPQGRGEAIPFVAGKEIALGNLGIDLSIPRFEPRAEPELFVRPARRGLEEGGSWLEIEASHAGATAKAWLRRGLTDLLRLGDRRLEVGLDPASRPLPFTMRLDEFQLSMHPGSKRAASFASHVRVSSLDGSEAALRTTISMNRPLDYAGFRIFQTSYELGANGVDMTKLSASYDPGAGTVYLAMALLVLGIGWYLRGPRRSRAQAPMQGGSRERAEEGAAPQPRVLAGLCLAACLPLLASARSDEVELPLGKTRSYAILTNGRVKPFDTFARETMIAIAERDRLDGLDPLAFTWGFHFDPPRFRGLPLIRIDSRELKAFCDLETGVRRYALSALIANARFSELVSRAAGRKEEKKELSSLEKDALAAARKIQILEGLITGRSLHLVPRTGDEEGWETPADCRGAEDPKRSRVLAGFVALRNAWKAGDAEAFGSAAVKLGTTLRAAAPEHYPDEALLGRELFFNDLQPFGRSSWLYLGAFLVLLFGGFAKRRAGRILGYTLLGAGLTLQTVGIGLRWAVAGRAPVSDMYESLVFMAWGIVALGLVLEVIYRRGWFALTAAFMGCLALAFAEGLPIDSAINPLVPALAHTSWLSIHVMTIMLAYAAFALVTGLGHVTLAIQLFRPGKTELLRTLSALVYKAIGVGVLFLAAGIAGGAVWANESWGRYWGWDPKETWSLITFFVYLAVIHARFAGWLHNFGLAVCAILSFLAVLMTYYGVNFLLGTGLHSYGFASGGLPWVGLFLAFELGVIGFAAWRYRFARREVGAEVGAGAGAGEP